MNEIIRGEGGCFFSQITATFFFSFFFNFYFKKNLHPKAFLSLSIM